MMWTSRWWKAPSAVQDDLHKIQKIRQRTRTLVSLGDCAITGNVPAMRNAIPVNRLLQRVYMTADGRSRPNAFRLC